MPTECSQDSFALGSVKDRIVVDAFDDGQISSDAGALLLGETSKAIGLESRLALLPGSPEPRRHRHSN
jgi:hypothetical protein